jgi:hypothetical protein
MVVEPMFYLVSFHAAYFENEWAKSKQMNIKIIVFEANYNCKQTRCKKKLSFGSK